MADETRGAHTTMSADAWRAADTEARDLKSNPAIA
jgi:hypothetical protein